MKTLREKFAAALIKRGEKQVQSKSYKYLTFTRRYGGFYFIGQSGALRFGATSSASVPCADKLKKMLLEESTQED